MEQTEIVNDVLVAVTANGKTNYYNQDKIDSMLASFDLETANIVISRAKWQGYKDLITQSPEFQQLNQSKNQ